MLKNYAVKYRKDSDPAVSNVIGNEKGKKHLKMLFKLILFQINFKILCKTVAYITTRQKW